MEDLAIRKLRIRFLKETFVFIIAVGLLDFVGFKLHLFWSLHYYDSVVHFIAGIAVGLGSIWGRVVLNGKNFSQKGIVIVAIVGVLIIGVMWEIFELTYGVTSLSDGVYYVTDTGADLLMDIAGGLIAALYAWKIILRVQNNNKI